MSVPTPNYVITKEISFYAGTLDNRTLAAGTFVRPIELHYVPVHVTEQWIGFNKTTHIFCYTRYGIVPILRELLRIT